MPSNYSADSTTGLRRLPILPSLFVLAAALGAAALMFWPDDTRKTADVAAQAKPAQPGAGAGSGTVTAGGESLPAAADRSRQDVPAPGAPGPERAGTPVTASASAQADPFRAFLEAHKNGQAQPALPPQQNHPQAGVDPFKQALEAAKRQSAAAVVSPFGTAK